ncbi:hypothetical protein GCM10023093_31060 [Nemorincola caseinilytica]|uniref:Uncharacterized protein n=1 Tax=Nemorincola caseinilytica TaxID=2054315 RepID=A0ABP8NRI4_9BACT
MLAGLLVFSLSHTVLGQGCSICTKTASEMDSKSAKGLNGGILYLAMLPLGIMGTLGVVWWRSKR